MKFLSLIIIALLVFLATSSGITKIMQMPQDVEFFGRYGFTTTMLMVFGVVQLLAGLMLIAPKTRIWGAAIVAVTFVWSAIYLIRDGNVPFTLATVVALFGLGFVIVQSRAAAGPAN